MMLRMDGRDKTGPIHLQIDVDNQFDAQGIWMKGNLHFHPHGTDDVRQLCAQYAQLGFDFLAATDYHFVEHIDLSEHSDQLIVLSGVEMSGTGPLHLLHLICIGNRDVPPEYGDRLDRITPCVQAVTEQGGLVFPAHPNWSGLSAQTVLDLTQAGVVGFEVSNRLCWTINGKERSDQLWHDLFDRGCYLAALGCDDWTVAADADVLGGTWTGVLAEDRSATGVMQAIRQRRTYASEGPQIHSIRSTDDGKIVTQCTPCAACHFMSSGYGVRTIRAQGLSERFEVDLAENGYRLKDWLCVCIEDAKARRAWSSAIRISNTITKLY